MDTAIEKVEARQYAPIPDNFANFYWRWEIKPPFPMPFLHPSKQIQWKNGMNSKINCRLGCPFTPMIAVN